MRLSLFALMLLAGPAFADETSEQLDRFKRECDANPDGCAGLFGSLTATIVSPTDFLVGMTMSDPDASSKSWQGISKDIERAKPDAAQLLLADGKKAPTMMLVHVMTEIREKFPGYSALSDVELAKIIVFG